jgi:hypothetical protein
MSRRSATRPLDGLSPRGVAAIARLEHDRFWPGAVDTALRAWARFVREPMHRIWDTSTGCGIMECCPDPDEVRGILHAAAAVLPKKDAREFRRRVAELDELW